MPTRVHPSSVHADPLRRLVWWGLLALLCILPYSTFLTRAIPHALQQAGAGLPAWAGLAVLAWKEILLVGLLAVVCCIMLRDRRLPFRVTWLDWAIAAFCLVVLVIGWRPNLTLEQLAFGLRVDLSVFAYYWVARVVAADLDQVLWAIQALIIVTLPVWLFGIAQTLFLPRDLLVAFGYSLAVGPGGNLIVPYQLVGDTQLVRAMATFPSANHLAQYGLVLLPLVVYVGRRLGGWRWPIVGLVSLAVVLTFSRAGLVGFVLSPLLVGGVVLLARRASRVVPHIPTLVWLGWLGLTLLATLLFMQAGQLSVGSSALDEVIFHGTSTSLHAQGMREVWASIQAHPWGTGISTAGPATANTGSLVVDPESITLQIALEYGWLGLAAFLGLIYVIYQQIDRERGRDELVARALLVSLTAILVAGIFLPTWFSWATITWWIVLGLFLGAQPARSTD